MRTSFPSLGGLPDNDSEAVEVPDCPRRSPQTAAWIVLSIAFGVFWTLLIGAFIGARHYYDTASVASTGTLTREEGIVLFRDTVSSNLMNATDNLSLREGDELLVGQGAKASLLLFDGSRVRLYSGSEMRIDELRKARFHNSFSHLGFTFTKGMARLEIPEPTADSHQFVATTPHGQAVLTSGSYGVLVTDSYTRISARSGYAQVKDKGKTIEMRAGEKLLLSPGQISGALPEGDPLIVNGDFLRGFGDWRMLEVNEPGRDTEPGQRMLATERIGGRESIAFRVERVSRKATHNETGLIQVIDRDVSDYQTLLIAADVRVDEQSLSGGGYMGYEYPMMIRVRYRDEHGAQVDWSHGFFHKNPEERPTPNGEWVPQGLWTHYDGDLMEIKPRPVHLISVEVLGAGHSFLSLIANLSLVGK